MNTPAGPWPTPGSILLAISLLLLLASMLCLTAAAVRTRRGTDAPGRDAHRRPPGRRTLIATLLAAVTAATLAPATAAHACVVTGQGVCVQLPNLNSNQKPVHNITLGGNNHSSSAPKSTLPTFSVKSPLPNLKVFGTSTGNTGKANQALSARGSGNTSAKSNNKQQSAARASNTNQTNQTNRTTRSNTAARGKNTTKTQTRTSTSAQSSHKTTARTNKTRTPVPADAKRPAQASKQTSQTTSKTKTKAKTKNKAPLSATVTWPGKAKIATKNPQQLTVTWPGQSTTNLKNRTKPKAQGKTAPPIDLTWPGQNTTAQDYCRQYPNDPQCGQSQGPATGQPTPTACPAGDPTCATQQPSEQNCQLTEEQQQQLINQATAQHAANQALYQQLLLKALLQQAALKASSAILTQQLSGHSGLSPQDVADLIKNGTVSPPDIAMAALQAASELDQETGGHSSQGTTCNQSQGEQFPPGAAPAQNNSDPNSGNNPGGQNQQQDGQQQGGQNQGGTDSNNTPANLPAYVWTNPRPGVDTDPQEPLPPGTELLKPGDPLQEGTYYYVVKTDGSLVAGHEDVMIDEPADRYSGHTSLNNYENGVLMAGTFEVDDKGEIVSFSNGSGHYQPGASAPDYEADPSKWRPLEDIARQAFADFGLPDPAPGAWDRWWN